MASETLGGVVKQRMKLRFPMALIIFNEAKT